MNAIVLSPPSMPMPSELADEFSLSTADWRVLVDQLFPSAKSTEAVAMALSYCRARKLDIFKRPVHIVPMWSSSLNKMVETVWPGIAEIRTTAARTGQYAGIEAVEFGPMVEREFIGTKDKWVNKRKEGVEEFRKKVRFPEWASVVIYRNVGGIKCAYHAKVFWEETYASVGKTDVPNDMWAKRPRGQLDKCVEAAALRKAFPEELGNTYVAEEMEGRALDGGVIEHEPAARAPTPPKPPVPPSAQQHGRQVGGEIIEDAEIVRETGDAVDAIVDDWPIDDTDYFTRLDEDMAVASDLASIEEIWVDADPMARFDGKPQGEVNQGIAKGIKNRHVKRIGGA